MNKSIIAIAMVGSLAVSLSAFANKGAEYKGSHYEGHSWSNNWYVGGGINGNAANTITENNFDNDGDNFEIESNDVGFDLYVGHNINRHWAAELGFTWVGKTTFAYEDYEDDVTHIYYENEVKQWNIHLVGMYKLPVADHFNLFGKFGAAYFGSTETFTDPFYDDTDEETEWTVGTVALTYGFGAEAVWDRWGVRAEYNVIAPDHLVQDDFYVADIISANIFYKFN